MTTTAREPVSNHLSPSRLIRIGLALGVVLLTVLLLWALLVLTDTAYDVWERLARSPDWFFYAYAGAFLGIGAAGGFALWRLFRPPKAARRAGTKPERPAAMGREELEQRMQEAGEAGVDVEAVRRELALLQERKAAGTIHVSLFGEISSGKSSLIRALLPEARAEVSAVGGTTREISAYQWMSPGGDQLVLTDMPGTNEVGAGLDNMARAEALRSHLVVYVCDGDLSRSQHDELQALLELEKPVIVALNKSDRYRREELELLLERLRERLGKAPRVDLVSVQAGGVREATRVLPDGTEEVVLRELPPLVGELREALQRHMDEDPDVLDRLRDSSVFVLVARRLDEAEQGHRRRRAEALTRSYSKKAMLGAMAAITPGSDLVIQGYLGVAMVKEMSNLYDVPVRKMDTDLLLKLVQTRVARSTTIMLAVAGNALKALSLIHI